MATLDRGIHSGESYQSRIRFVQNTFFGISAGSILVLLALGLVDHLRPDGRHQHGARRVHDGRRLYHFRASANGFKIICPAMFDYYLVAAIPAAFLVAGFVGLLVRMGSSFATSTVGRWKRCWRRGASD